MKQIFFLLCLILCFLYSVSKAQDYSQFEGDVISEPKNERLVRICGGNQWEFSSIQDEFAFGATIFLGVNLNNRLRVCAYSEFSVTDANNNTFSYFSPFSDYCYNHSSYGLMLTPRFFPDSRLSLCLPIKLGGADVEFINTYNTSEEYKTTVFEGSVSVSAEWAVCKFFKLNASVGFRFSSDAYIEERREVILEKNGLNRLFFTIGGVFGK